MMVGIALLMLVSKQAGSQECSGLTSQRDFEARRTSQEQPPPELRQRVRSLDDFTKEGEITSYLGMVLRQARSAVDTHDVKGLMVVSVIPGSAAAEAALENPHNGAHWVLVVAGFAATMVFRRRWSGWP